MARPKSRIFACPRSVMKMFAGLISRWTIPAAWAASRASASCVLSSRTASYSRRPWIFSLALSVLSFEQLHHDEGLPVVLADLVNRADIGMIERGGGAGLPFESRHPNRVLSERIWKDLDRNFASEVLVLRPIHLSHATLSQGGEDFVMTERRAGRNHQQIGLRIYPAVNLKGFSG